MRKLLLAAIAALALLSPPAPEDKPIPRKPLDPRWQKWPT